MDDSWHQWAKCLGESPHSYDIDNMDRDFAPGVGHRGNSKRRMAQRLCEGCPVMRECAVEAIQQNTAEALRAGCLIGQLGIGHSRFDALYFVLKHGRPPTSPEFTEFRRDGVDHFIEVDLKTWHTSMHNTIEGCEQ